MRAAKLSVFSSSLDHPEAVAWDPHGYVVAGGEAGQLYRLDPTDGGIISIVESDGYSLGIAIAANGDAYVCDLTTRVVRRVSAVSGAVAVYSSGAPGRPFAVPNYPAFAEDGRLFVTDSGQWGANDGAIFVVEPGGGTRVATDAAVAYPNGLAIDPEGRHLYVVETALPGVSRFALNRSGNLGQREVVVTLPNTVPDGLAFTVDAALLVSCFRPDVVYRISGTQVETLADDWTGMLLNSPTNLAFIGDGLDQLIAANLGGHHLTLIDAGLVGAPLNYPEIV